MSATSVDLFHENRRMVESAFAILETLAARLNAGEVLPNAILGDVVEFLREFNEEAAAASEVSAGDPCLSRCVAQHQTARGQLHKMQWALESLERREAGAVGAFVVCAREYIRAHRDHVRTDDALFPKNPEIPTRVDSSGPAVEEAPQSREVVRRFNRMLERFWRLTPGAKVSRPPRVPACGEQAPTTRSKGSTG